MPKESRKIVITVKPTQIRRIINQVTVTSSETTPVSSEIITEFPLPTVSVNLSYVVYWSIPDSRHEHFETNHSLSHFLNKFQGNRIILYVLGGWSTAGVLIRYDDKLATLANVTITGPQ
jgi:hypothetical protein